MGNQSMNSWKLGTFFIFSLMLFAAVFSNTGLAADGPGKAIVAWGPYAPLTAGPNRSLPDVDSESEARTDFPLAAGTRWNRIKIIYTADAGDNMGGGLVRVKLPGKLPGWRIPPIPGDSTDKNAHGLALYKHVRITSEPTDGVETILYETDGAELKDTVTEGNLAMVQTISEDMVAVKLSDDWKRGGTLRIRFGSIRTGVPTHLPLFQYFNSLRYLTGAEGSTGYFRYANYQLTVSSRTKNGVLVALKKQPSVRVTNIHAHTDPFGVDRLEREFTVEPATVYEGEKGRNFKITFTAPGPMYVIDSSVLVTDDDEVPYPVDEAGLSDVEYPQIRIRIPEGMRPAITDTINVSRTPGVVKFKTHLNSVGTKIRRIDVFLDGLNQGQTVTVRYKADINTHESKFELENLRIKMPIDNDPVDATKKSGGVSRPVDGSGKVELTPSAVEAGSRRVDITLTYTAQTDFENKFIGIRPKGIVIDDTNKLQTDNSAGYGYVSSSMPGILIGADEASVGLLNITLKKNKSVTVTIHRVDIVSEAREYQWPVDMGQFGPGFRLPAPVRSPPILSVTKTSGDAVKFEVVGDSIFPAGSEQTIAFRFTAESTPIRDGSVSLTIPEALGSKPTITPEVAGRVMVEHSGGKDKLEMDQDTKPGISNRTINVGVKRMAVGDYITITYGSSADMGKPAVLGYMSGDVKVTGTFKASATTPIYSVSPITITLGKIGDGIGLTSKTQSPVEISSPRDSKIKGGSRTDAIEITFTAAGTMDGGKVALEVPSGWGLMQDDPTKRNYVMTSPVPGSAIIKDVTIEANGRRVVATINKLGRDESFKFIYGGGTAPANNGVEVQNNVGLAEFMVLSDGNGDDVFTVVDSLFEQSARQKILNPKAVGKIIKGAAGVLKIEVTSAQDGTGDVAFEGDTPPDVRAADDNVQLMFTYVPTQTIQDGALKFTVPAGWSPPQVDNIGEKGYTEVIGAGLGSVETTGQSLTVPIFFLDRDQTITITYGASESVAGRVNAPDAVGDAAFKFAVKGHEKGNLVAIPPVTLTVGPQASGKGTALITPMGGTLHAGDADREIKVVYTAAGQMVAGAVELTIPTGWSAPTAESVTAMIDMTAATPTFSDQMVTVDGVNVLSGGTVTFAYTGTVQPTRAEGVAFGVKSHGSLDSDSLAAVGGAETMLTVDVQEARSGSGMGMVDKKIVQAGETGVDLTFTYTAVGQIDPPRGFHVEVPRSWGTPTNAPSADDTKNTYTVEHRDSSGGLIGVSVEKLSPIGRKIRARVRIGGLEVEAGDQIIFTYENADAPTTAEVSPFRLSFDGKVVADSVQVRVQDSTPSRLSLESAGTVSADEGTMPLGITVGLQDADGNAAAMEDDVAVTLTSSSTTGAFSMMADETGTESLTVTINGGDVSTMVYYTDSTVGTATITATATGLMSTTDEVMVTTSVIEIRSVTIDATVAKDGDTIIVTAMATSGQAPMVDIGTIVTDGAMVESPAGTYTRTDTLAMGTQEETYSVSVSIGDVMMSATDMLTVDNTDPTVTVTAPESAANGDEVIISATVTDASAIDSESVKADVSMLDSTQTDPVALAMGDDGAYSASVTISDENSHANGSKTVTVTAMDAAGNSGMGEATVELVNMLSYTSMIPVGQSLFHVPLDVEGLDTVGALKIALGDSVSIAAVYDTTLPGSWNSKSDDVAITADLGILLLTTAEITHTFEGQPWGGGASMINLQAGSNFIGLPVDDPRITNVSDLITVAAGAIVSITVVTEDGFTLVGATGDAGDGPVMGDAAYLVTATSATTIPLLGEGWSYGPAGAAPVALTGYLANMLSYTSMIPVGQSLFHVPLDVEGLDTVGALKIALGDSVSIAAVYDTTLPGSWNSKSDDVAITADLGILLLTTAEITHTFEGQPWGGGASMINLQAGSNFIGLPVDDPRITNASDIITVAAGAIASITVVTEDGFTLVAAAGDAGDGPVMGDAAYLVTATSATTIPLLGEGWSNGDMTGAAPVALAGHNVDGQTAVLDVQGAVVDEITGLAREGFRVKVKNLSTKTSLNRVTSAETAGGYNMTFVDLKAGHAARVGDVLEISADSPNPLIGVQPVRHIVTVDDVKSGIPELEDLIAYEIPAETELLRNYPNPFNPETWIPYRLAEDADVSLTIYDVNGTVVRSIDVGHQSAAIYESRAKAIYWDGRNRFGEQVASGVYFYSLSVGDFSGTRKMVILK